MRKHQKLIDVLTSIATPTVKRKELIEIANTAGLETKKVLPAFRVPGAVKTWGNYDVKTMIQALENGFADSKRGPKVGSKRGSYKQKVTKSASKIKEAMETGAVPTPVDVEDVSIVASIEPTRDDIDEELSYLGTSLEMDCYNTVQD